MPRRTIPLWAKLLIFAAGMFAAAEIGSLLSVQESFASIWPPAGLFVAMLLISDERDWPALFVVGIASNTSFDLLQGRSIWIAGGFATANLLEVLIGALVVRGLLGSRPRLDTLRETLTFGIGAGMVAPLVGASIGTATVCTLTPSAPLWTVWYTWWIGDCLGVLIVGTCVLTCIGEWDRFRDDPGARLWPTLQPIVASLLVAIPFSVLAYAVFSPLGGGTSWKFLTSPGILACGIVGGPAGAALGLLLIAVGGVAGTVTSAPVTEIASAAVATRLFQTQAFFAVWSLSVIVLAGVIAEDRRHAKAAGVAAERYRMLFDSMREGVAHGRVIRDTRGAVVDWVYLQVNGAFPSLTGFADVVGHRATETLPHIAHENPELLDVLDRVAGGGEHLSVVSPMKQFGKVVDFSVTSPAPGEFVAVFEDATQRIAEERALAESNVRLEKMAYDVAGAMGRVVEVRDPYTQGHQVRVASLARLIGAEMGLDDDGLDELEMASLLHDIGKLHIPVEILTKPGALSGVEMNLIREHPMHGFELLRHIDFPWAIPEIVWQHHERLDGSGYPRGLKGDEILPQARVLGVADVVEAIASFRPYRAAVGLEAAMHEITSHPEWFDADVTAACVRLHERGAIDLAIR